MCLIRCNNILRSAEVRRLKNENEDENERAKESAMEWNKRTSSAPPSAGSLYTPRLMNILELGFIGLLQTGEACKNGL